ncbi:MAG: TetR/AcrR family transcriptional regulator [Clostridia bacterium]|nr:TetR/AcrR family transcriptional regulator [Clostridia bacterium]
MATPNGSSGRAARNSPRRPRISKEPEERRQEIIETALALFSEKGYEDTSIQDIANRMNVSPALCYKYFRSKAELFAETSEYYARRAIEQLQPPEKDHMSATETLDAFLQTIFEFVLKHKEYEATYHLVGEIRASRMTHVAEQMTMKMIPIVERGVREGAFHCDDIPNTTRFLVYGLMYAFHDQIPAQHPEEYIVHFYELMKTMISRVLLID